MFPIYSYKVLGIGKVWCLKMNQLYFTKMVSEHKLTEKKSIVAYLTSI